MNAISKVRYYRSTIRTLSHHASPRPLTLPAHPQAKTNRGPTYTPALIYNKTGVRNVAVVLTQSLWMCTIRVCICIPGF